MSDEPIDETEAREAEALHAALERGRAEDDLPEDALQTAALVRYSAGGGELAPERLEALLPEVLEAAASAQARRAAPGERAGVPFWRWLLGLGGAAAAVALVLVIVLRPGRVEPTALPAPGSALLEAQMARLAGEDDAAFDAAMRDYRGDVLTALTARYGAR